MELSKGVYSRERTTDAISAFAVAGQMLMMNTKPTHYTFLRKIIGGQDEAGNEEQQAYSATAHGAEQ